MLLGYIFLTSACQINFENFLLHKNRLQLVCPSSKQRFAYIVFDKKYFIYIGFIYMKCCG